MERQYNFFSGYVKFRFSRNFSWGIFFAIFFVLLLILWIGALNFSNSFIVSLFLSFGIALAIAMSKTNTIVTYVIGGEEYLLFDEYSYFKKILKIDTNNPLRIDEDKLKPKSVQFIARFLVKFKESVENKSELADEYTKVFKLINLDNIGYVWISRKYSKEKIKDMFEILCKMADDKVLRQSNEFIEGLNVFKEMAEQDQPDIFLAKLGIRVKIMDKMTAEMDEMSKKRGYNIDKYKEILNKD